MLTILWFRRTLRRHDHPALAEAAARGPVLPAYILDPPHPIGGAGKWWLHHSLAALERDLAPLWYGIGDPAELLPRLARESAAQYVFWSQGITPEERKTDRAVQIALNRIGIDAKCFAGDLLFDPASTPIGTAGGTPYKVFTAYWRAASTHNVQQAKPPQPVQTIIQPGGLQLEELTLQPQPDWASGWEQIWQPGERGAFSQLDQFLKQGFDQYEARRDYPSEPHISRLSPHLHWGELSIRLLWHRIHLTIAKSHADRDKFLSEVGWREFAHYLLHHWPTLTTQNWNAAFDHYPWRGDDTIQDDLTAWQRGMTGYPLVDAGMRELWQTGFMHNRVRMVAASFLTKHLRIHWRHGLQWFADTLVDADEAANAASWQWVAGSGADAAPYFRIFNPVAQASKFDPEGTYIRRWVPELAKLPTSLIHAPIREGARQRHLLSHAQSYPLPIVDHDKARVAALDGFQRMRGGSSTNI